MGIEKSMYFIHSFCWLVQNAQANLSLHPFLPTSVPSSLTSSCHRFLGLTLSLVSKFIYNTFSGILFSSVLCTYFIVWKGE